MKRRLQLRRGLNRLGWRAFFRLSRKHTYYGVSVAVLWPDDEATALAKVEQALGYIQQYAPYQHRRLQSAARVVIFGTVGPLGKWHQDVRLIQLRENWVEEPNTHPVHIAATIIHEYTHAWLDARGIEYVPARRRRLERICYRAQARFTRRVPGCEELTQYYADRADHVLSQSDAEWSDLAFRERDLTALDQLGTPTWLMKLLRRRLARPPAV